MLDLRPGDRSSGVAEARRTLAKLGLLSNVNQASQDQFDESTELAVRAFQQNRGLTVDGRIGDDTYRALQSARWKLGDRLIAHNATTPLTGDDVIDLQRQLLEMGYASGRADGFFGPVTGSALRSFQRDLGLLSDGVCGPDTLRSLRQLEARRVVGGRPQMLREMMAVADAGPNLLGKRIVIDPAHGGEDPGGVNGDHTEADIVFDLATRLEGRLTALGVTTVLTRGLHQSADELQRAQFANGQGADLVLSLHLDWSDSAHANGVSTYFYGAGRNSSTIGERFAELVQRELVARTGLLDARSHAKSWPILQMTSMPTVRVDLGYLSSPVDLPQLVDPAFRTVAVEGMLVAIQRLFLPQEEDPPTGVLRLPAYAS
jgi:N-acetylmuramoyl-L-alanine amidase